MDSVKNRFAVKGCEAEAAKLCKKMLSLAEKCKAFPVSSHDQKLKGAACKMYESWAHKCETAVEFKAPGACKAMVGAMSALSK